MLPAALIFPLLCHMLAKPNIADIPGLDTYPQLTLPVMSMAPYASILSSTVKSPWRVMLLPDLTDPAMSNGPWIEMESSLLTDLVLRTVRFPVEPWNPEELPVW